jgi:hypothetical protein
MWRLISCRDAACRVSHLAQHWGHGTRETGQAPSLQVKQGRHIPERRGPHAGPEVSVTAGSAQLIHRPVRALA